MLGNANSYKTTSKYLSIPNNWNNNRQMTDEQLRQLFDKDDEATNEDHIAIIDSKVNKMDSYTKQELEDMLEAYFHHDPETASLWIKQEKERQANELIRIENEKNRENSYETLETNATSLVNNLTEKIVEFDENENTRKENEVARINAEEIRKTNESNRINQETTRNVSEEVRNNNEETRKSNESSRILEENVRVVNEEERKKNETKRVEAEILREQAEAERKRNETTRQEQETNRQESIVNMQTNINSKIENVENRMQYIETNFDDLVTGTGFATKNYVDGKISGLVNSAPDTLDTLKELSDALGNDPNFATTVTNKIGQKADKSTTYTKVEVDNIVNSKTQINDEVVNATSVWSSSKTNSELAKKSGLGHTHSMEEITGLSLTATNVTITDSENNFTATTVEGALSELYKEVNGNKKVIIDNLNIIKTLI